MMPNILIKGNEGIAKFFTLTLKGHLNKVMEFKCNTCIILGYLHSPWNLERHCVPLPKPKNNKIPAPYCDDMLNHATNEGIVKLVTLMVKGNEIITKMKVLQLHIKTLLKWPYTINVANLVILSCTYTNDFALVHWTILIIYEFENIFQLHSMFT
jgi:hypothetical protein